MNIGFQAMFFRYILSQIVFHVLNCALICALFPMLMEVTNKLTKNMSKVSNRENIGVRIEKKFLMLFSTSPPIILPENC